MSSLPLNSVVRQYLLYQLKTIISNNCFVAMWGRIETESSTLSPGNVTLRCIMYWPFIVSVIKMLANVQPIFWHFNILSTRKCGFSVTQCRHVIGSRIWNLKFTLSKIWKQRMFFNIGISQPKHSRLRSISEVHLYMLFISECFHKLFYPWSDTHAVLNTLLTEF